MNATAASAQEAQPAQPTSDETAEESTGDEIVVTGIRASLDSAARIKRNADSIVDVISSEDMGAFPDQNMQP